MRPLDPTGLPLRPARLRQVGDYTALQFTRGQTQSRMLGGSPDQLLIDYTRTMLAALLWQPRPRSICMVGLGGGSQAKFIHRHLPEARLEVVENHPGVIALRREFRIPDDDARLQVVLDDGARFLAARTARYDMLLVDGYDAGGIPAALSTPAFHDACRDALRPGGVLATNLFCADPAPHVERLRRSFGAGNVLVVEEARMSNQVVFAWTGAAPAGDEASLARVRASLPAAAQAALSASFERVAHALRLRKGHGDA
ncbi:transferase [Luteimonas sp. MC1828]|uniref:spermine/spermidine synthase domain-containing protein n=1 Tax=Luteimonas sp. MC1828 TaxID=2799787 RepID=UPI0018F1C9F9|nr:transferase [Luteimonas sp. MC1828]